MTHKALQVLSMFSATALATASFVTPAQARTIMASAGRAVDPADYSCFRLSGSAMINVCAAVKVLEIPLVIDGPGAFTVKINVRPPGPTIPISCQAFAVNENNTAAVFSPRSMRFSPGNLFLSTTVPIAGALVANCNVPLEGHVNTITW